MKSAESAGMPPESSSPVARSPLLDPPPPQFYCAGNNGRRLIEGALSDLGWEKLLRAELVALKTKQAWNRTQVLIWADLPRQVDFSYFVEGWHLINRNPKIQCLTTKTGLLDTLRDRQVGVALASP